ncbi:polysaccharide deacetylase family protein [Massilia sp. PAMC28688]|uniref:polysaccharide deacetylase family protein n=1 Tax=Massilia sp. PAMC28688 TaxID=2861283 RepID=UPI001C62BD49|nr:polysaccharide deacetylase family protein [Massilia sp. PAMC28688]QYF92960.1 polysaccharide deacetylase family protein [Massilia sp. PAMC28688]
MQLPLSILVYHRVLAQPDPLFPDLVDAARFAVHLRLLRRWCRVLPLAQAVRRLHERSLPSRAVCITFDGGYADHASVALPLLQRFGLPATFFVASGFLDGGYRWSDAVVELVRKAPGVRLDLSCSGLGIYDIGCSARRRAVIDLILAALATLPPVERLARVHAMTRCVTPTMLSSDQVIALHRAGMDIGAHTVTQQALSTLSNAEARAEIGNSRARLEALVQAPVRMFSYPEGKPGADFEKRHGNMLRSAGFEAAVTTATGAARAASDPFELPRLMPQDRSKGAFLLRLGSNLLAPA